MQVGKGAQAAQRSEVSSIKMVIQHFSAKQQCSLQVGGAANAKKAVTSRGAQQQQQLAHDVDCYRCKGRRELRRQQQQRKASSGNKHAVLQSQAAMLCVAIAEVHRHARSAGSSSSSSMWASSMQSCLVDAVQVCRGATEHGKQQHRRLGSSSPTLSFATAMNIVVVLRRLVDVYRQARAQTGAAKEH